MSKIIRAITAVFVFLSVVLSCVNVWADTALSSVRVTGKSLTGVYCDESISDLNIDPGNYLGANVTVQEYSYGDWNTYNGTAFRVGRYRLRINVYSVSGEDVQYKFNAKPDVYYNGAVCTVDSWLTYSVTFYTDPFDVLGQYPLVVKGRSVTVNNASDIWGDGVFGYDASSKTLTVNGDCEYSDNVIKNNGINGLTILVAKNSTLRSTSGSTVFCGKYDTVITGTPKLTVISDSGSGIYINGGATLTIDNADISVSGKTAISGNSSTDEKLVVNNSNIAAKGTDYAISHFGGEMTLTDCKVSSPQNAVVDNFGILGADGISAKSVTIVGVEYYPLTVAGVQVSDLNADDILNNGVFGFDPQTNTLTVNGNCTYNGYVIRNTGISGLKIAAVGDSELTAESGTAIGCGAYATTITCGKDKTLKVSAPGGACLSGANLTVENADLELGGNYAIRGTSKNTLTIKGSKINAKCSFAAISAYTDIMLDGCRITSPNGAVIQNGTVYESNGTSEAKEVVIEPEKYALRIAGNYVTALNANDILGDGVFGYDHQTKTLTIAGDCTYNKGILIDNTEISGLTIKVAEDSVLTSSENTIVCRKDTKITGDHKLTLVPNANNGILVLNSNTNLAIENTDIAINGVYSGIMAGYSNSGLVIKNSNVDVSGSNGAITNFGSVTLDGCEIVSPQNAVIANGGICESNGETPATNVKIKIIQYDLKIAEEYVTSQNADDVLGNGVFRYDVQTNTLTVNGDYTYTGNSLSVIYSYIPDLTINIACDSVLRHTNGAVMTLYGDTKITSSGNSTLKISAVYGTAIGVRVRTLTIENVKIEVFNSNYGIRRFKNLLIKNSSVSISTISTAITAEADSGSTITLDECSMVSPTDAVIKNGTVYESDGTTIAKNAVIAYAEEFPLEIAGTTVTRKNANDIIGGGVFAYDHGTKTLTVNGSCAYDGTLINNMGINGLTINVAGDSEIVSTGNAIVCGNYDTKITGEGKLLCGSTNYCGILIQGGGVLTIENANITVAGKYGISGMPNYENLVIKNSNVTITGTEFAIGDFGGGMTFVGCDIISPANAVIKNGTVYESDGITAAGNVVISFGDVNFDGVVNNTDATLVLKYISMGKPFFTDPDKNSRAIKAADADGKNDIDMLDVIAIMKIVK
ncbi:MAG: dockerin type I repeat-containing protein [Firmicutes bacterium]|nr:dockerin type I repeat-containing protein [Bacillota bacterium]